MRTICQAEQFLLVTAPFIFFRQIYAGGARFVLLAVEYKTLRCFNES